MIVYEVGQRFPHEKYLNHGEITVSILNEVFFDVFVSMSGITEREKQSWKKGKLTVCLFKNADAPFVVFDFGDGFSFDVNFNINKVEEDKIDPWLNSEGNVVNMFLVDSATGILLAQRMIGLQHDMAESIRDICEKQAGFSIQEVEMNIARVLQVVSTEEMIKRSIKKQIFK